MKSSLKKLILISCIISPLAFADPAPVVSITPASPPADTSTDAAPATPVPVSPAMPLTLDQRVSMLERQLSAMNQIDLVNQVSQLEQQVQDLQGQVQVLSHTLQTVQTQTTSQYADLDQRLQKATTATSTPASTSTSTATTSDTPVTPKGTTDTKMSEKDLYDAAYKNIREQKNADGIAGMKKYLDKYPDGKYASNAHYWLGQLYILKGDDKSIKDAVLEFNTVIKKYPDSKENKEANLKLGFAYLLQNKSVEAKAQFKKVIKEFPGTSVAQLAEARLAQLS